MEYYDSTHHETFEVLSCETCFEPEWTTPFPTRPKLKAHWCTPEGKWQYGFYGTDVTYSDPAEALEMLTIYENIVERLEDGTST